MFFSTIGHRALIYRSSGSPGICRVASAAPNPRERACLYSNTPLLPHKCVRSPPVYLGFNHPVGGYE